MINIIVYDEQRFWAKFKNVYNQRYLIYPWWLPNNYFNDNNNKIEKN